MKQTNISAFLQVQSNRGGKINKIINKIYKLYNMSEFWVVWKEKKQVRLGKGQEVSAAGESCLRKNVRAASDKVDKTWRRWKHYHEISGGREFPKADKNKRKDPEMRLCLMCLLNGEEVSVARAGSAL